MASRGQPGALSAFARLIGGVEDGLTGKRAREMEDEEREQEREARGLRRVMANLQVRSSLDDMGAEQIDSPAVARLRSSIPIQETGQASESPLLPKDTETFQLPDPSNRGAILNYRINPDKTREARADRRVEERDLRTERRQTALESLRASLRAPERPRYQKIRQKGGRVILFNEDTREKVDTGIDEPEPSNPLAQFLEGQRQINERQRADNWQRIYMDALKPRLDKWGEPIPGTVLTPAEAAAKADEAMGGRPELAPKIKAPSVPGAIAKMGTSFTPSP